MPRRCPPPSSFRALRVSFSRSCGSTAAASCSAAASRPSRSCFRASWRGSRSATRSPAGSPAASARPLLTYASLELVVAVAGVAMTAAAAASRGRRSARTRRSPPAAPACTALRFGVAFALLVVPATAMGATLPVLVGALAAGQRSASARVLGRLYGWNTLGAVAGVIGCRSCPRSTSLGVRGTRVGCGGARPVRRPRLDGSAA